MSVAMTGASGFLGWHTRALLHLDGETDVRRISLGRGFDTETATEALDGADRLLHLAGVNRATDDEVLLGNKGMAWQVAGALRASVRPPKMVVYADSTQAGNGTAYGDAKAAARVVLQNAAAQVGAEFVDLELPNLFGEHGRPFYNSVTATFSHLLATGQRPVVRDDRELTLLHVQDAAEALTGHAHPAAVRERATTSSADELCDRLTGIAGLYSAGELPDLTAAFDRDLFNTLRSAVFGTRTHLAFEGHQDARGRFTELVRSAGGPSQTSFSTTAPGVTRGRHVHRRKVERFVVLDGSATIRLRRLLTDETVEILVSGDRPTAVDMPTLWAHEITNTGSTPLTTLFWSNDLYDPKHPDTFPEPV